MAIPYTVQSCWPQKKLYMVTVYGVPIYHIPTVIIWPYTIYSMVYSPTDNLQGDESLLNLPAQSKLFTQVTQLPMFSGHLGSRWGSV